MTNKYDLADRTLKFAKDTRELIKLLPKTIGNLEDGKQLVRSSGSVGANYIEANESLGTKDFYMKMKICRKESKESRYWLTLVDTNNNESLEFERNRLTQEATEFILIFNSIIQKGTK